MVSKGRGTARGRVTKVAVLVLAAAALSVALSTPVSAAEAFPPTQLTNNNYTEYSDPAVSGDRVVWQSFDGSDDEIYTWTPTGGTVRLTNNGNDDSNPAVSGDCVVWMRDDGNDDEIYTWTPAGVEVQLTNNGDGDYGPRVSGDRVVWQSFDGSDDEIYTWTSTGGMVRLTNNGYDDYWPEVSGDRVVWVGSGQIYTWTPADGVVEVTNDENTAFGLGVSGDRVVWWAEVGVTAEGEVFTWTPAGGTVRLTTNNVFDYNPMVSGNRVVWERYDDNDYEIYTWTPSGGTLQLTNNSDEDWLGGVSGDRVVWCGSDASDSEIYTWTPTGGVAQATNNSYDDHSPGVYDDRLIWQGQTPGGSAEIFTSVAHTRFDDKSAKITYLPGWSRWDNSNYWAAFQDTYAYTDKKGDKVMVTFSGTSASVVACTSNTKGKAQVSLYNGTAEPANLVSTTTVDLYSPSTKWKQQVYSTGTIAAGTHTLVIECLYQKNWASGWYTIDVDGFDILGTLEQSPTVTKIDDKDYAHFTYSPGIAAGASTSQWSRWDNSGYYAASDDTYAYTDQLGFKTSFTFEGTYASWLACTSNSKGKAKVTVDGDTAHAVTVDLYSPTTKWKQKVFDTGILSDGSHTIEIECLRQKNPASSWYTINVDRFDVIESTP